MSERAAAGVPQLLFVTPGDRPAPTTLTLIEQVLEGGVTGVLLREPQLAPPERRALYSRAAEACRRAGARALVSRDVALAAAVGADGVHTGWRGPSVASVRRALPEALVGRSAHWPLEAEDLAADYMTLSPFRPTPRSHARPLLDDEQVAAVLGRRDRGPVLALGGLGPADVPDLPDGVAGVAVLRALADARDPRGAAAVLRSLVDARLAFGGAAGP